DPPTPRAASIDGPGPAHLEPPGARQRRPEVSLSAAAFASGPRDSSAPAAASGGGLSILLLDASGVPLAGAGLGLIWHCGEGDSVQIEGATDARGILTTEVPEALRIESLEILEDVAGFRLFASGPFEASGEPPG